MAIGLSGSDRMSSGADDFKLPGDIAQAQARKAKDLPSKIFEIGRRAQTKPLVANPFPLVQLDRGFNESGVESKDFFTLDPSDDEAFRGIIQVCSGLETQASLLEPGHDYYRMTVPQGLEMLTYAPGGEDGKSRLAFVRLIDFERKKDEPSPKVKTFHTSDGITADTAAVPGDRPVVILVPKDL